MGIYGEEEEELMANTDDPIMKEIWENKIPTVDLHVKPVFQGKEIMINWVINQFRIFVQQQRQISHWINIVEIWHGGHCSCGVRNT